MKLCLRILCVALTVLWLAFIFNNSTDSATVSSEKSSTVYEVVNEIASSIGIQEEITESTIRSSAHFVEFAVLGVFLALDVALFADLSPKKPLSRRHLLAGIALPVGILFAAIDEGIQTFSPGRAPQWIDLLIDSAGVLCGIVGISLLFLLVRLIVKRTQRKPS